MKKKHYFRSYAKRQKCFVHNNYFFSIECVAIQVPAEMENSVSGKYCRLQSHRAEKKN